MPPGCDTVGYALGYQEGIVEYGERCGEHRERR